MSSWQPAPLQSPHGHRWPWVLVGLMLIIAGCTVPANAERIAPPQQALAAAQARWEARRVARYQLVVQEASQSAECQQSLQIDSGQIAHVLFNRCGTVAHWTVPNLYTWVAQHPASKTSCYPSTVTCVCYITYTVTSDYDPTFGYPLEMTSAWKLSPNWSYIPHWQRLLTAGSWPACRAAGGHSTGFVSIRVLDFVVLP